MNQRPLVYVADVMQLMRGHSVPIPTHKSKVINVREMMGQMGLGYKIFLRLVKFVVLLSKSCLTHHSSHIHNLSYV